MVHTAQMAAPFPLPTPHPEPAVSVGGGTKLADQTKEPGQPSTSLPQPGLTALAASVTAQQNGRDPPTVSSVSGRRGRGSVSGREEVMANRESLGIVVESDILEKGEGESRPGALVSFD